MPFFKSLVRPFALVVPLALAGGVSLAEPADWNIDPEHFSIVFGTAHVGYQQQMGMFLDASGSFRYDPQTRALGSGRVEIQAQSIFTDHEARDDHLRSGDFLDAGSHPLIVFEATGFTPDAGNEGHGTLSGELTLRGETHPVQLDVTINKRERYPFGHGQETLGISASTTIERSQWGMDYGVSDGLVGDAVSLRFELEAIRQ